MKKQDESTIAQPANVQRVKKKGKHSLVKTILRRFFLVLFIAIVLVFTALILVLNMVFNGPSPTARNQLTMTLIEASATKWIPALFIGEDTVAEIRTGENVELAENVTDVSAVVISRNALTSANDEWAAYPDGIRIETVSGNTYNATVMIVRNPEQVYLGISTHEGFSTSIPGKRLTAAIEDEGAIAAVNGGAFNDNGTTASYVGTLPAGLVYSEGECVWTSGKPSETSGFAGFTEDNILIVHKDNISKAQAEELNIRDGCCFGPVLIMNGEINQEAYNSNSGWNPRTAIGQRKDGAVVFVCIDGRQAGSAGGTYKDVIDIMIEYGVVNACNMDGGSSSIMVYRDTYGLFGEAGTVQVINSYSLLQERPRKMPTFWMDCHSGIKGKKRSGNP